jgi:cytochrome c oxidase subunit 1
MSMAGVFSIFAGIYYWYPLLTGRLMNELLGKIHFWISLVAAYGAFFPMHFAGLAGEPRHYAQFTGPAESFANLIHVERGITWSAFLLAAAQLVFLYNVFQSARPGSKVGAATSPNPWRATTLEWSPIPHPTTSRGPYVYGPGTAPNEDFLPQWQPEKPF